ncbi:hypothetical protein [Arthrobacter sp. TE12232]
MANKFQTGFDQPLPVAMYVDKKLSGVSAEQTLSRLNRTAVGRDQTFVLDFVNDPDEILASFQPYFREAALEGLSDPNVVHDPQAKLDTAQIYLESEVVPTDANCQNGSRQPACLRWQGACGPLGMRT